MFRMSTVKRAGNVYVVVTLARDATRPIKSARNGIKLLNKNPIDTWQKKIKVFGILGGKRGGG